MESSLKERFHKIEFIPYLVLGLALLILVIFIAYPLSKVLLNSFLKIDDVPSIENFTLANFSQFFSSALYKSALMNTLLVGFLCVLFSSLLGIPMAYFVARTEVPFKTLFLTLGTLPLILPPFVGAYSWVLLFGRKGVVNFFLNEYFGFVLPDIYGAPGVVIAMTMSLYPFIFLLTYGALLSADPYLEESATIMGASRWDLIRTVSLPLVTPAIAAGALIVFMRAVGNFGVPALLGGNFYVLPTLIHFQVVGFFNLHTAGAIAIVNISMVGIAILISQYVTARRSYVTITGTTRGAQVSASKILKWGGTLFCTGVIFFSLLPHITVIVTSFTEGWAGTHYPTKFSFNNYKRIFQIAKTPIFNSLFLATTATIVASVIGTLLSYITVRKRFQGKWILDLTVMLPFILPGIVVGVAILSGFSSGLVVLTGTWMIMVVGFFIRRMPYIFRSSMASLSQIDIAVEEASAIAGAPWGATFLRVTLRTILIVLVLSAITLANRLLGRKMSQMFKMV
jgi:iron(III) transport system permease protein